ncbi:Putative uncharacterized protein [Moritella viscosa]|nr:Putative uncharacterized protein [Moritella viscosa]SHO12091.1 Putative uncharacterized protein [Moritella viscosa]SHO17468.1 Putative uncharacterized protein [Moritella viscosa]SHO23009.1 Putative uncharacterized protein [Moritella viscosa]
MPGASPPLVKTPILLIIEASNISVDDTLFIGLESCTYLGRVLFLSR